MIAIVKFVRQYSEYCVVVPVKIGRIAIHFSYLNLKKNDNWTQHAPEYDNNIDWNFIMKFIVDIYFEILFSIACNSLFYNLGINIRRHTIFLFASYRFSPICRILDLDFPAISIFRTDIYCFSFNNNNLLIYIARISIYWSIALYIFKEKKIKDYITVYKTFQTVLYSRKH